MKRAEKKRPKSVRAMTVRLAAGTLAVWLACMVVATLATAQMLFSALLVYSSEFAMNMVLSQRYQYEPEQLWESEERTHGYLDYQILEDLSNYRNGSSWSDSRWYIEDERMTGFGKGLLPLRNARVPMETAILYTDENGDVLFEDGNYLYFGYATEETWNTSGEFLWEGYGWIDLSDAADQRYTLLRKWYEENNGWIHFDVQYLRITGIWDGNRIEPVEMHYISEEMLQDARTNGVPDKEYYEEDGTFVQEYSASASDLMKRGALRWEPVFNIRNETEENGELVTVYASYPQMTIHSAENTTVVWDQAEYWNRYADYHGLTAAETKNGVKYENLKALLKDVTLATRDVSWGNVCYYRCGLDELIVLNKVFFRDTRDYDWSSVLEYPAAKIVMTTAVRSTPLRSAVMLLRNVYIGTFLLALLIFQWLRKCFRENLIQPVEVVNASVGNDVQYPHYYQDFDPDWQGGFELVENYKNLREQLRMHKNEIKRLETALDYSERAEAKRRQMASNIAHELKTPLAVVHSYAEGLQEHIAEEKREQYLQTILAETERMDGMVLEMLDLSRLEAGKVKLARDEFDLAELAKSVFEALAIKAEEKNLQVTLAMDEPRMVSADEGRIRQVLENYISNAVKYTPEGGMITAAIRVERDKTTFRIENESAPLPHEALTKIWDSFYRVDDSRTGRSGTGLGLAIAKSIVELHGGSVDVRNTDTGVEFRFTI